VSEIDPAAASEASAASRRLLLTLELMQAGFALTRQRLRRDNPEASAGQIDRLFVAWLRARPEMPPGTRERPLASIPDA
jgi:hypothetical protein